MKKKLLILGATTETIFMVNKAEEMGIETYVVDPYKNSPAKQYSSHPIDVDCFDIDAMLYLIKQNNIDGVLPGCADILVPVYEEICRRSSKFCYVSENIVRVFGNKKGLKDMLVKHGLPVIQEYSYEEVTSLSFRDYPIFIKPTDNNSSKGMSVVYNADDFASAYKKAIDNSRSKTVLIEKYMTCNDFFMGFVLQNGQVSVSFTSDRFVNTEQKGVGTITQGMIYPSRFSDLYFSTAHSKMLDIFKELDFKNGILHIQGFVDEDGIKFYDPALRITGGQEYLFLEKVNEFDLLKCLISFAITGQMSNADISLSCDHRFNGKYACNLAFSVKEGRIGRIDGIDYAKSHKNVINVTQEHFVGDLIDKVGTAQQNFSRMHLLADNSEEMAKTICDLQKHVIAYDNEGNNLMLKGLNANRWLKESKR